MEMLYKSDVSRVRYFFIIVPLDVRCTWRDICVNSAERLIRNKMLL